MGAKEFLEHQIRKCLEELGILKLTELQEKAIPLLMRGKNALLIAPTGVGKTEAAVLPFFQKIMLEKPEKISLLYLTPLRALNRDMLRRMSFFGDRLGIDVAVRHGDTSQKERRRQSKHPPDVLITTPETLQIMFTGRRLRSHLMNIKWVVVDEIHELAGDERGGQLSVALERLATLCGRDFQRVGLSATIGNDEEVANFLAGVGRKVEVVRVEMPKGMRISVEMPSPREDDARLAEQLRIVEDLAPAVRRCRELIEGHNSTLFFVNTRDSAEFLSSRLKLWDDKFPIGIHHGSLSKEVRIAMEDEFKSGMLKSLICTSSLELGIDVGHADFVLQFNSPRQVGRLIQRIGRSGHGVGEVSDGRIVATDPDDFAEGLVIARRALSGEVEDFQVRENDECVLANQIVAMCMSEPRVNIQKAYDTIRKAYPFRKIKKSRYMRILKQLSEIGTIHLGERVFARSRGSIEYFYENISMIPDEKTYLIVDISSRRVIGTLDESYIASYADVGTSFIMRGVTWQIVEMQDDRILVERYHELGSIPSWTGEEIPVPYEVAMEVGALRRIRSFKGYVCNDYGKREFINYLNSQNGLPVPTDKLVTIESSREEVIINLCFGSKTNETLGRILAAMLSARLGESVGMHSDPYRVMLQPPRMIEPNLIREILLTTKPTSLLELLKIVLRNSHQLRWFFLYSAKKFGAVKKDIDYKALNIARLMSAFEGTPLLEEALNRMIWQRMDVRHAAKVLEMIQSGEIEVQLVHDLSRISLAGHEKRRELVASHHADIQTLTALKKRVERQKIVLACVNCLSTTRTKVRDVPEKIKCKVCGSVMLASIHPSERPLLKLFMKKNPTKDERRQIRRLMKNASLIKEKGKKAVFVLAGRGVGPDVASRILARLHQTEEELLKDLLASEVNYARTRRFWE